MKISLFGFLFIIISKVLILILHNTNIVVVNEDNFEVRKTHLLVFNDIKIKFEYDSVSEVKHNVKQLSRLMIIIGSIFYSLYTPPDVIEIKYHDGKKINFIINSTRIETRKAIELISSKLKQVATNNI